MEVKGPGVLDVSVWRQQRSMTVHLVNLTNPMMMKGPFRELIPVGEQQVFRQAAGRRPGPAGAITARGPRAACAAGWRPAEPEASLDPRPRDRGD